MAKSKSTRSPKQARQPLYMTPSVRFFVAGTEFPIADLPPAMPCPFCGGTELEIQCIPGKEGGWAAHAFVAWVECMGCYIVGPHGCTDTDIGETRFAAVHEAADLWNMRPAKKRAA